MSKIGVDAAALLGTEPQVATRRDRRYGAKGNFSCNGLFYVTVSQIHCKVRALSLGGR
jgi:hypothetical protein